MNALNESKIKLLAVDCLKSMKQQKTFRQLSQELSLPAGVLNRYINGYVLPKYDRAMQLIEFFSENYLPKILDNSRIEGSKYIVTADILSQPFLLNVVAYKVFNARKDVDVILTAAVDGIPLAGAIANFLGVRLVYAKLTQEFGFSSHYVSKSLADRPTSAPFYLPKRFLRKNSNVLIVDDVIRAGRTFDALTSICEQAKSHIVGIFALFITSSAYKELKKKHKVQYLSIVDG